MPPEVLYPFKVPPFDKTRHTLIENSQELWFKSYPQAKHFLQENIHKENMIRQDRKIKKKIHGQDYAVLLILF